MQSVCLLGSTGSVGLSTLSVIDKHPDKFKVFALSAHNDFKLLYQQCLKYRPKYAVLANPKAADSLLALLNPEHAIIVLSGSDSINHIASLKEVDTVVSAIVGAAGLESTLAAVEAGKKILIANKEPLVMMGEFIVAEAKRTGAKILPLDSEHNAIFQCLPDPNSAGSLQEKGITKIILTGSGGPFRTLEKSKFSAITPERACKHPNWSMGRKISVDSATMMNKGLEFIEACHLFSVTPDQIDIVIHPQSTIHSMVQYTDGSVLAQLGTPDMRTPIAHALSWPDRIDSGVEPLNFFEQPALTFETPDLERFPCLRLALDVAKIGGTSPTVLNAANEIAVAAFLEGRIQFNDIAVWIEAALTNIEAIDECTLESVLYADKQTRDFCQKL